MTDEKNETALPAQTRFSIQLKDLRNRMLSLAEETRFARVDDERGDLVATLVPTEIQKLVAAENQRRLRRWSEAVQSILRRRGSAQTLEVAQLCADLSDYALLRISDLPDVTANSWRASFRRGVERLCLQLQQSIEIDGNLFPERRRCPRLEYDTLEVRIDSQITGSLKVSVSAPQGTLVANVMIDSVQAQHFLDEQTPRGRAPLLRELVDIGQSLFKSVFVDALGEFYVQTRERAIAADRGLRLYLQLEDSPQIAGLPWELLHDGRRFVCLSVTTPLVRAADPSTNVRFDRASGPLRVLMTISSPASLAFIDGARERMRLEAAVAPLVSLGLLELEVAPDGTLDTLRRVMRTAENAGRPFHVWHFAGHGGYDDHLRRGELALCGANGELVLAGRSELTPIFDEHPPLRLAVLNACEGAHRSSDAMAATFMECGAEAVLAMQLEIAEPAALILAEELYGGLADGYGIEGAVTEARRAMYSQGHGLDWMIPVLFMRGQGLVIDEA